jgi:hypothetical protein
MPRGKKEPELIKGGKGPFKLNQTAPIFNDRRTKRNRDRSTQLRNSIERSKEE